jgi:hypothetical protein
MRIHQDGKAAARRPVDGALRCRRHPGRRMRPLQRLGQQLDVIEGKVPAPEAETVLGPGLEHDVDGLAKALGAFLGRHAEGAELRRGEAAAGAPVDAATRQHVEQRHFLGEPQRMIEGGQRNRRADAQPPGARRRQRAQHVHRRADAEGREVMLGQPHRVEAAAVHDFDALEGARIDIGERAVPTGPAEELQHAELHVVRPSRCPKVEHGRRIARQHGKRVFTQRALRMRGN